MHYGLIMECDYRYGTSQEEAFDEAFAMSDTAEKGGLDGVWLAERHFAAPRSPLDGLGAGIPSVVSAPLIISAAIVARTERLRVGVAVNVLPLNHPVRMAEEIATLDQISHGRVDFGVGRSGFMRAYEGYDIPYTESRERFQENLEIILAAWTNERFSYEGKHYTFNDVCVIPKPYQDPHPPLRMAATTKETFPQVGKLGYPVFVGLRGLDRPDLALLLDDYRKAWKDAGHAGEPTTVVRIPTLLADTSEEAERLSDELLVLARRYFSGRQGIGSTDAGSASPETTAEVNLFGTAEEVVDKIEDLRETYSTDEIMFEVNWTSSVPRDVVMNTLRILTDKVIPKFK